MRGSTPLTIAFDTAAPNGTPTGPPTSSTPQACLSQPITIFTSAFYPPVYLAPTGQPTDTPTWLVDSIQWESYKTLT